MKSFLCVLVAVFCAIGQARAQTTLKIWDGTNIADVSPANTGASAAKKGLIVTTSPNSGGAAGTPAGPVWSVQGIAGGTALPVSVTSVVASTVNQGTGAGAASPWSAQLSDGSAFYTGAKTGQFPAVLIGGRLDVNLGASGITLGTDPIDRAGRLLGIIYGSQGQQLLQSATNYNLYTELRTGGTAYDARQIRALSSGTDSVTIVPSGTQAVSGTVTSNQGTAAAIGSAWPTYLTDGSGNLYGTALRPLRIDPTGSTAQPITSTQLPAALGQTTMSASLPVAIASNQTAVPMSAASLPLPTGAATESTLSTLSGKFGTLGQKASAGSAPVVIASDQSAVPVSGTVTVTPSGTQNVNLTQVGGNAVTTTVPVSGTVTANIGTTNGLALDTSVTGLQVAQASTTAGQSGPLVQTATTTAAPTYVTGKTNPISTTTAGAVRTDSSATTQPISAASLPLPSGAATSALQTTGNASLASIDTKTPSLGQAANASSVPVTLSSTQTGTAGTPSAQVLSVQGVSGGTGLTVAQATAANLNMTDAATVSQGSTTSGQKGQLTQAAVTASAPSYADGQTSPLSLTTGGALRVSAVAGVTPTTTAVALTTTGATVFASATTSTIKARKIYNRTANPTVYCVYYDGSNNVTSEATASFAILPGQTWEMPTYSGIVEYTGPINCATSTSTGSVQALQVL